MTLEQFIREVDSYIRWYNPHRIKLSLGGRSLWKAASNCELQHNSPKHLSTPPKIKSRIEIFRRLKSLTFPL